LATNGEVAIRNLEEVETTPTRFFFWHNSRLKVKMSIIIIKINKWLHFTLYESVCTSKTQKFVRFMVKKFNLIIVRWVRPYNYIIWLWALGFSDFVKSMDQNHDIFFKENVQ
jgi:hypothetical protein